MTAEIRTGLLQHGDLDLRAVQRGRALLQLPHDVVREPAALRVVHEHTAPGVLRLHHEGGALHARVAEADGLMEVVDAVQEVTVVAAGDAQDLIVAVVGAETDEAGTEEVHAAVHAGPEVWDGGAAGLSQADHELVWVLAVRGEDGVPQPGLLQHLLPHLLAVQLQDVMLDALQEQPIHGAVGALVAFTYLDTQTHEQVNIWLKFYVPRHIDTHK